MTTSQKNIPLELCDLKGLTIADGRYYAILRVEGKVRRIKLPRVDEGTAACRAAYNDLVVGTRSGTVATLLHDYVAFEQRRRDIENALPKHKRKNNALSPVTIKGYWDRLHNRPLYEHPDTGNPFIAGLVPQFGDMPIESVRSRHVREFIVVSKAVGRAVSANRDKSLLSAAYEYALARSSLYPQLKEEFINPCLGVRKNEERPSRSYVEDDVLEEFLTKYANIPLQFITRAGRYSGIRATDLRALEDRHLRYRADRDDPDRKMKWFIDWEESKTGKENGLEVGPKLLKVIQEAQAYRKQRCERITRYHPRAVPEPATIFVSANDVPWTVRALGNAWGAARQKAIADGMEVNFSFRTMRAKAQTDARHNVIGHVGQMRERYTRRRSLQSSDVGSEAADAVMVSPSELGQIIGEFQQFLARLSPEDRAKVLSQTGSPPPAATL